MSSKPAIAQSGPLGLQCRGVQNADELDLANDLIASVHGRGSQDVLRWVANHGPGYPGFRQEHTRVAYYEGVLAGALRLNSETLQLGEARLRMGGFGWISVAPPFRRRGIASELIRQSLHYLHSQQYHVSMLFGTPNFYRQFGFTEVFSSCRTHLDTLTAAATATMGELKVRDCKPGDVPAMVRLHTTFDANMTCSVLRTRAHYGIRWQQWQAARAIIDAQGRLCAYFLPQIGPRGLVLEEIAAVDPEAASAVVAACADLAQEHGLPWIDVLGPASHPAHQWLLAGPYGALALTEADAAGVLAVINVGETLEGLLPEWEERLRHLPSTAPASEFTLLVDRRPYRVRAHHGAMDIAQVSGRNKVSLDRHELAQLITGATSGATLLEAGRWALTRDARALFEHLFPARTRYVWPQDRFQAAAQPQRL